MDKNQRAVFSENSYRQAAVICEKMYIIKFFQKFFDFWTKSAVSIVIYNRDSMRGDAFD